MSEPILRATQASLKSLVGEYLEALDGIPDEDISTWKPSVEQHGGGEMNTLAGLSVHTALAGTWMLVHQIFGEDFPRDRDTEFQATATRAEIDDLFAQMLTRFNSLIESNPDIDLSAPATTRRPTRPDANKAEFLIHVADHTAQHLGHAQIHKQIWLVERGMGNGADD